MTNMRTRYALCAVAASLVTASPVLMAAPQDYELSANFGATSNYIWRGMTQSNDTAAISGGVDYSRKTGVYAGIWTSSLDGGNYELDIYAGYNGKLENVDYDAGIIMYQYPVGSTATDVTEAYINANFKLFTVQGALTLDKENTSQDNDIYASISTKLELKKDVDLTLLFGLYEFDADAEEDYAHIQAKLSKGEYSFALDKNDKDTPNTAGDMRFSASWNHSFDL